VKSKRIDSSREILNGNVMSQAILLILTVIELMVVSNKHGQPKQGEYNIWSTMFSMAVLYIILISGGFFK